MSNLPPYKIIDRCCQCGATNTAGRKVAKDTFCLSCHKNNKAKEQMDKAKLKNKLRSLNNYPANVELKKEVIDLSIWFAERRKEMTGYCLICGGKTSKDNDREYKRSIAHLLAKRSTMFPSVATHEDNWMELCFWGKSCHKNFDDSMITFKELQNTQAWDVIVRKFKAIYPFIADNEKKNLPALLLQEIDMEQGWNEISKKLYNDNQL